MSMYEQNDDHMYIVHSLDNDEEYFFVKKDNATSYARINCPNYTIQSILTGYLVEKRIITEYA